MAEASILALIDAYERLVAASQAGGWSAAHHHRFEVEQLLRAMGLEHINGDICGLVRWTGPFEAPGRFEAPTYQGLLETLTGYYGGTPTPEAAPVRRSGPPRDGPDLLPKTGRNVRIGCERYESGTWIHGRPHDCPRWARP